MVSGILMGQQVYSPPTTGLHAPPTLSTFAPTQPLAGSGPGQGGTPGGPTTPSAPACTTTTPFTVSPMPVSQIPAIIPQGNINPSAHVMPTNHAYLGLPGLVPGQWPLFAPGDMTLTNVVVKTNTENVNGVESAPYEELALGFQVCGGINLLFDHVNSPSAKIQAALNAQMPYPSLECSTGVNGTVTSTACNVTVSVPVSAGEQIAVSSGITPTIDFGAWNTQGAAVPFLEPRRYLDESNYNVCPVSLFTTSLQAQLGTLLGTLQGTQFVPRTAAPVCGVINFDVAGTVSGNWWPTQLPAGAQSVASDESGGAAFMADNINPAIPVISLGNDIPGIPTGRYVPAAGTPAFTSIQYSVTPQMVCFANLGGASSPNQILLVSMIATDQLRIEGQTGTCSPTPAFTSQALTVYR